MSVDALNLMACTVTSMLRGRRSSVAVACGIAARTARPFWTACNRRAAASRSLTSRDAPPRALVPPIAATPPVTLGEITFEDSGLKEVNMARIWGKLPTEKFLSKS